MLLGALSLTIRKIVATSTFRPLTIFVVVLNPVQLELTRFCCKKYPALFGTATDNVCIRVGFPEELIGAEAEFVILCFPCVGFTVCRSCSYWDVRDTPPGQWRSGGDIAVRCWETRWRLAVSRARHGVVLLGQFPDFFMRHLTAAHRAMHDLYEAVPPENHFLIRIPAEDLAVCAAPFQTKPIDDPACHACCVAVASKGLVFPASDKLGVLPIIESLKGLAFFLTYLRGGIMYVFFCCVPTRSLPVRNGWERRSARQ